MSYPSDNNDARKYHEYVQSEPGHSAMLIQKKLLLRLWAPHSAERVLEVGCGTGIFLEWFAQQGHLVTGIDPSRQMLNMAELRLPGRVDLDQGHAEDLPYDDNAFDTVAMISVLEFVDDPLAALQEAFRVARRHVLVGVTNKYSLASLQRLAERLWRFSADKCIRTFSIFELKRLVETAMSGPVPHQWGSCLTVPPALLKYFRFIEYSKYFQWHPFGHFIAMRVDLCYPIQTAQDPLLCEIGPGLGAGFHSPSWRLPAQNIHQTGSRRHKLH